MYLPINLNWVVPDRCPCCDDNRYMYWTLWKTCRSPGLHNRMGLHDVSLSVLLACEQSGDTLLVLSETEFDELQTCSTGRRIELVNEITSRMKEGDKNI